MSYRTPAIVHKLMSRIYKIKIAAFAKFKIGDAMHVSRFKIIF
jgi:hypothetical protein